MRSNFLKLNGDKSEYLIFGSANNLNKLNVWSVHIDQASVSRASHARNLGLFFYSNSSLEAHINKLCSNAFYQIRNISKVRAYLWRESTERLVHTTVTSRLDMGNILLYGLPDHTLLILKLEKYFIRNSELLWFSDYLQNRTQAVKIDGNNLTVGGTSRLSLGSFIIPYIY